MAWNDSCLLVVSCSVAGKLEDFGAQVFQHSSKIDGGAGANPLSVVSFAKMTMDTAHGKLKASTRRTGLGLGSLCLSFTSSRHGDESDFTNCVDNTL
jgi:hypothetical protein